ncbi:MAG: dsbC [Burkholderiaceae bacterium]|nr:dsbC [Burkholderiaceae bacterium]
MTLWTHKKQFTIAMLFSVGLLMGCNVSANNTQTAAQEKKIKTDLESKVKQLEVKSVKKMTYGDLYEVVLSNNDIIYTNANTDFTLIGHMINNKDMSDMTQTRLDELNVVDFKTLPLNQSFSLVKGAGKRQIIVFEDPNCGYCKLFRKTLEQMDNLTIHTFAIDILGADSTVKAKQLLCAKDPAHAWDEWMLHKTLPKNQGDCDTSNLAKNNILAEQLGITGTPTIIFENGKRIPGAASKEDIEQILNEIK